MMASIENSSLPGVSSNNPSPQNASNNSGRKQACLNCRQRKKKCDALLPVCSLCAKSRARCIYQGALRTTASYQRESHTDGSGDNYAARTINNPIEAISSYDFNSLQWDLQVPSNLPPDLAFQPPYHYDNETSIDLPSPMRSLVETTNEMDGIEGPGTRREGSYNTDAFNGLEMMSSRQEAPLPGFDSFTSYSHFAAESSSGFQNRFETISSSHGSGILPRS